MKSNLARISYSVELEYTNIAIVNWWNWPKSPLALIGPNHPLHWLVQTVLSFRNSVPQSKETYLNFAELFCLFLYQISPHTVWSDQLSFLFSFYEWEKKILKKKVITYSLTLQTTCKNVEKYCRKNIIVQFNLLFTISCHQKVAASQKWLVPKIYIHSFGVAPCITDPPQTKPTI